ncbi:GNAT family N-acetyltransferase [Micromonospora sp. LOL_021]|uniref:GNAT family N-acetyltransferase n=1 Tax=Micromonospora sp. LOL_021 TaxID=3345417 RepID=UPI003A8A594C
MASPATDVPTDFGVRPATVDELDTLVGIEQGPETTRYLGITGRAYHERAYADPDQEQIVAEAGTSVVGFVVLAGLRRPDRVVELRRIVVSHRHRGAGYGRRLFRAAVARAYRVHGARQVWLDVKPDNARGRTLYASEGFVPDGTIPDPMCPDGVLLLMRHTPQPPTTPRQE